MSPPDRQALLDAVRDAGRENSTATLLFHTAIAERAGLGPSDHKALDIVLRSGPLTIGDLAVRVGLTPAAMSALVDRLEARGYARRRRDPDDRRRLLIEPVPEGLAVLGTLFGPLQDSMHEALGVYSDADLAVILDFLRRATGVLQAAAARLREET